MRVVFLAIGSRGDVYPYVALGVALARAGHRVRIATFDGFRDLVERHALEFHSLPDPLAGLKRSAGWVRWQSSDAALWSKLWGLRGTLDAAHDALGRNFDACHDACRNADALVSGFAAVAGAHVAERRQLVHLWGLLQPFTPTGAFPHSLAPFRRSSRGVNRATYRVADTGFGWCFDAAISAWRAAAGMPRSGARLRHPGGDGEPVLYAFSRHVLPSAPAWPAHVHVTGYWPFHDDSEWRPPDLLAEFVAQGPPPVAVFHGAITGWRDADRALALISKAIDLAGCRAVIVTDRVATSPQRLSPSCLAVNWVSVRWLFPSAAMVVHHGGAGTTAETLRAGCPSVVLPSCFDQPFWADALHRLGAAPPPLRPAALTAPGLAALMRDVIERPDYAHAAAGCARTLAGEDGVSEAVRVLERYAGAAASGG